MVRCALYIYYKAVQVTRTEYENWNKVSGLQQASVEKMKMMESDLYSAKEDGIWVADGSSFT